MVNRALGETVLDPEGREPRALHRAAEFNRARVLEIGAGDGRLLFRCAAAAAHAVGIETAPGQSAAARRACPSTLARRFHFAQASAIHLPFRAAAFDVALFGWSL